MQISETSVLYENCKDVNFSVLVSSRGSTSREQRLLVQRLLVVGFASAGVWRTRSVKLRVLALLPGHATIAR
eukprot:scaffold148746_cov44-Prasinocladus_malaysianus.AAC.1